MNWQDMYLKTLNEHGHPSHGGGQGGYRIGEWTTRIAPIPCAQGYHVCRPEFLLEWISTRVFVVEISGEVIESYLKLTAESARLVRELPFGVAAANQFALDCYQHVSGDSPDSPERSINYANACNDQYALSMALARNAMGAGSAEVAVMIAPKRAAQASAWRAFRSSMDQAWLASGGSAPPDYWIEAEKTASAAKVVAHESERGWQLSILLSRLGLPAREKSTHQEEWLNVLNAKIAKASK